MQQLNPSHVFDRLAQLREIPLFSAGVLLFLISAVLTHVISAAFITPLLQPTINSGSFFTAGNLVLVLLAALVVPAFLYIGLVKNRPLVLNTIFWLMIFIIVTLNSSFNIIPLQQYGDTGYLPWIVKANTPFTRWLAGSALLGWIYQAIESLSLVISPITFIKIFGAFCMTSMSIYLLNRYPNRLAILLPMFSPIWFVFLSGYDEYYPFIAGLWLLALSTNSVGDNRTHTISLAILIASLPLFYIAFAPLSLLLILNNFTKSTKSTIKLIALSALFYWLGVELFWSGNIMDYIYQLPLDLNLGEKNTLYEAYQGQSTSDYSPLFELGYALSLQHLSHLIYMQFWGGGIIIPMILGMFLLPSIREKLTEQQSIIKKHVALGVVFIWQLSYFILMIPKLGPSKDVDLFFSFYLLSALLVGLAIDATLDKSASESTVQYLILSMVSGSSLVTVYTLLIVN